MDRYRDANKARLGLPVPLSEREQRIKERTMHIEATREAAASGMADVYKLNYDAYSA